MRAEYNTDDYNAYQTIEIEIDATAEKTFYYIGTAEGIKQWFPELTFDDEPRPEKLVFTLGDNDWEYMDVLEFSDKKRIIFTWGAGDVQMELDEIGEAKTVLTIKERLPLTFENIVRDFAGWYFQAQNIRQISESKEPQDMDEEAFKNQEETIKKELGI